MKKKPLLLVLVALWVTYLWVASTVCASANVDAPRLLHRTQTIESQAKPTRFNETALDVDHRLLKELAFNRLSRISIPVLDTDIVFIKKYHANRTKTSTWIGKDAAGEHTLVLTLGENHFFGKVIGPGKEIVFQPSGVGSTVVSKQLDLRFEVPLIDDDVMAPQTREEPDAAVNIFDDGTRIDVMVLYTVGMANAYPGSQIDTRIQYLVDLSNLALSNSQVNTQINLVYSQVVNYPDDSIGDMSEALDDLTNNVGVFSDIEALRTAYGADQVTLLRRFVDEGCGMAWLLQRSGNSRYAYSVVHNGSKTGGSYCDDLTFIHELGHNLGCQHDRGNSGYHRG